MIRLIIILGFLISTTIVTTSAQSPKYVEHIGSEEGLTSQLCPFLEEDDLGNIWVSSYEHIQKYDGYNVKAFPFFGKLGDAEGLLDMKKDMNGNIWIVEGYRYAKKFKKFNSFTVDYKIHIINALTDEKYEFEEYIRTHILGDHELLNVKFVDGIIYLITKEGKVFRYTNKLEDYGTIKNLDSFLTVTKDHEFLHYVADNLVLFDRYGTQIKINGSSSLDTFRNLEVSLYGDLFFHNTKGDTLDIYEFSERQIKPLRSISLEYLPFVPNRYTKINKLADEAILINTKLFLKNNESNLVLKNSIEDLTIFDYIITQSDLGIVATNLGLYVLDRKENHFRELAKSETKGINSVRAIYSDENMRIYHQSKVQIFESKRPDLDLSFMNKNNNSSFPATLYQDPLDENQIWNVGYVKEFVNKIDVRNKTVETFKYLPAKPRVVHVVHRSSQTNEIYFGASLGLFLLHPETKELVKQTCLSTEHINHIIEHGNKLWIASGIGITEYDELSKNCTLHPVTIDSVNYSVQFIHSDEQQKDILWIGTQRGGIIRWDRKQDKYTVYNTSNGLSNNDVHAILEDAHDRLWISTNKYLNCLDKKTGNIYIFTEQDGITHSEFNRFSYFYDKTNNHIYFGGLNGYTYFNPDSIITTQKESKIKLRILDATKTKVDAVTENIHEATHHTGNIDFHDNDVSLQLYLSTNYLSNNKQRTFSYRIKGLQNAWQTQSNNELKINRLPYGEYTIEIISDLNRPAFTSETLSIDLNVIKPIHKTLLARIIGFILFLYILWYGVQKYLANIKERNLNLEKIVSERTNELQELNQLKNKIFAILSHDLRNPISSLSNITEKIKFLSKHNRLDELDLLATQTKGRLNALNDNLNNILVWATTENNMLIQDPQKYSIHLEIKNILSLYSEEIKDKNLKTEINLDPLDQVFIDISILQTILRNFINNAIKFSFTGGKLLFAKCGETNARLQVVIEDNGIGIKKTDSKEVGNVEKIRRQGKGSGIGLQICKDLAAKSDIIIHMKSKASGGTVIIIDMPKK